MLITFSHARLGHFGHLGQIAQLPVVVEGAGDKGSARMVLLEIAAAQKVEP